MAAEPFAAVPPEPSTLAELRALVQRAQAGDAAALPRVREILDGRPEIWRHVGDLTGLVEHAWISALAADNPLAVESMKRTAAELRVELAGEHPTRLERLLVDQVIACWMECKYLEKVSADPGRGTLGQSGLRLKRLESAQKRYLNAIKTLTSTHALLPAGTAPARPVKLHEEPGRERA